MMPLAGSQLMQTIRLDRALEYSVIQSWDCRRTGPTPGMINSAESNSSPRSPPQKAPVLLQYFMRPPVL
jgi:hypothetical protein